MKNLNSESEIILSERHLISSSHPYFSECDHLTFLGKNLYNATLFYQRASFFKKDFQNYYAVNRAFTHDNQEDYRALPAKVSKQVQMLVDKSFKSYFALVKKKVKGDYNSPVRIPRYLHKTKGRCTLPYPKDALSLKKEGIVKFSKTGIEIPTKIEKEKIQGARIVPKGNHFVIEILYKKVKKPLISGAIQKVAFIDPGLNNLMTVTSNVFAPLLYSGKNLKSMNRLANKKIAQVKSSLSKRGLYSSPLLVSIYNKRSRRITDALHKLSSHLVNQFVSYKIDTVVFGHNLGQKQDIKLGSVTNQNFVQLPFYQLISLLKYKCELQGIRFITTEESYTSKCSFLDLEPVSKQKEYLGRRIKRGLFQTKEGLQINADVNGSLNIGRKYLTKLGLYTEQLHHELASCMANPKRICLV
jgi:transposase, IS605 orfB family